MTNPEMTELLPCPGCGFDVIIPFDDLDDNHPTVSWGVLCGNPDCEWQINCAFISKEHAVNAWNTRTPQTAAQEQAASTVGEIITEFEEAVIAAAKHQCYMEEYPVSNGDYHVQKSLEEIVDSKRRAIAALKPAAQEQGAVKPANAVEERMKWEECTHCHYKFLTAHGPTKCMRCHIEAPTNPPQHPLGCDSCQSVGMWHCSDPINCGGMKYGNPPQQPSAEVVERVANAIFAERQHRAAKLLECSIDELEDDEYVDNQVDAYHDAKAALAALPAPAAKVMPGEEELKAAAEKAIWGVIHSYSTPKHAAYYADAATKAILAIIEQQGA